MEKNEFEDHILKEAIRLECELDFDSLLCVKCGSGDIDQRHWVGTNNYIIKELIDPDEWYCNNCEARPECFTIQEFLDEELYTKLK